MGHFERKFQGERGVPTNDFGTRKVESLGYRMVKKIAEKFNRLSRVHQRHRQTTDRQTDRRQTTLTFANKREMMMSHATLFPNRAVLYSVRGVVNDDWAIFVYATKLQYATCTVAYCNFVAR